LNNILSDLIITKIISASTSFNAEGARTLRQNRGAWALSLKFEGETVYTNDGRKIISNESSVILLPRGSDYEWECTESGHCIIIDFECDASDHGIYAFHTSNPEKLLSRFRELEYKLTLRAPMYMQECIRELYGIIISLSKEKNVSYTPSAKTEKIRPALDFIAKNYAISATNDSLATLCGLSTVYFRKLFSETLGKSPISYLHEVRVNKAKEMLASDFTSISDIAYSLGYASIYDFSRVFRKYTGTSPSRYAKRV